jgi:hypothetical protein
MLHLEHHQHDRVLRYKDKVTSMGASSTSGLETISRLSLNNKGTLESPKEERQREKDRNATIATSLDISSGIVQVANSMELESKKRRMQ